MIFTKRIDKDSRASLEKPDRALLFCRRKFPKVAEWVEDKFGLVLSQTLKDKHLPEVRQFVHELYGVQPISEPVFVSCTRATTTSLKDLRDHFAMQKQKFSGAGMTWHPDTDYRFSISALLYLVREPLLRFLYGACTYIDIPFPIIRIPTLHPLVRANRVKQIYSHEYTHHLIHEHSSSVIVLHKFDTDRLQGLISECCNEGLSYFAGQVYCSIEMMDQKIRLSWKREVLHENNFLVEILGKIWSNISNFVARAGTIFSESIDHLLRPIYHLKKYLANSTRKKMGTECFVSALENGSEDLLWAIDSGLDGTKFIIGLAELELNTPKIFSLVTNNLPTIRELFYPQLYLERMRSEGALID